MAEINLNQVEADALIAVAKKRVDDEEWLFPGPGDRIAIPLTSLDKRENFMLDVTRGQIKLTKATYQNRAANENLAGSIVDIRRQAISRPLLRAMQDADDFDGIFTYAINRDIR